MSPSDLHITKAIQDATTTITTTTTTTTSATSTRTRTSSPATSSSLNRHKSVEESNKYQIFLGGSCNPTTWRQNVAIPYLEMHGITYYNPQVDDWTPDVVKIERQAKSEAQILFFVIDRKTRSTVSLVESAFMAGDHRRLVLVIYPIDYDFVAHNSSSFVKSSSSSSSSSTMVTSTTKHTSGTVSICGEVISVSELHELKQARFILQTLVAERKIPIFYDILQALNHISTCLSEASIDLPMPFCHGLKSREHDLPDRPNQCPAMTSLHKQIDSSKPEMSLFKDVYLSLDDNDASAESEVIPILEEQGLSFNYMPVTSITNLDPLTSTTGSIIQRTSLDSHLSILNQNHLTDRHAHVSSNTTCIESIKIALEREMDTIQRSRVLLVVITNKCRGLSIMVLASHFMALFKDNVVLCIQYLEDPCSINGDTLTKSAIADYNRGRVYLCDYASKSQVPVFSTIKEAIDCCSRKCGYNNNNKS